jgi:predicted DNA-binding transcriptional regulator AlpA
MTDQLLRPKDVAAKLQVSLAWVHDHTSRAEPIIPHFKLGKHIRFVAADIDKFLESIKVTKY